MTPKYNLLYYKHLVDYAIIEFFKEFNDSFILHEDKYVLSKQFTKTKLKNKLLGYVIECLMKYVKPYKSSEPNYYFIIGACEPQNSLLYSLRSDSTQFPNKLSSIVENTSLRYILKESDISIDTQLFNDVFLDIFNDLFRFPRKLSKKFSDILCHNYDKNVIFVAHNRLDCYLMFKALKKILGNVNCVNIFTETNIKEMTRPIVAVNELIKKYNHNKIEILNSEDFNYCLNEISNFISFKLS